MLRNCDWSSDGAYRTGTENEPLQFYLEGLANSTEFYLLLGYFSSAAINLLSVGFATFISKGGRMKMVINHLLSERDKIVVQEADASELQSKIFDLTDIEFLEKVLNEYDQQFFECLTYLIYERRIEIKIIKPKGGQGIAHYKSGVFGDGHDFVGYQSSCNFTFYGLSENLEQLLAFSSWEGNRSNNFINSQLEQIDNYFSEQDKDVEYISTNDIEVVLKAKFGRKDLDELLVQENVLLKKKGKLATNSKLRDIFAKLYSEFDLKRITPRFPYVEGPRDYQNIAFERWRSNNQQGLFAMATGTGKTITALNCLLEIYRKTGYYKALILVPTITLVNQWESECRKFNFHSVVKVYSRNQWKNSVSELLTREAISTRSTVSYIIISTYASYVKENVFIDLNKLSPKVLLIADECHNMGSGSILSLLPRIVFKRRIGLSATPERQYDEDGNRKISTFFNSVGNYTYEYSMSEAIKNGVLCKYYYFPHLVSLTNSEMDDYKALSIKISKFFNNKTDSFKSNPILTALLLARKRIIHKAYNKLGIFSEIIGHQYKRMGHLKYTLVYVPEGSDPNDFMETDYFLKNEEIEDEVEAMKLIDVFSKAVTAIDPRVTIRQFISSTKDKDVILEKFANGEIEVLTSMKCLDEGVDVPRSELAIFCASTGNPRQFVQRRGRILRKHIEKRYAYIHDLVVIPEISIHSTNFQMERSLLKKELERVNNFALLSENSSHTVEVLYDIMNHFNLNLYDNE